MQNRNGSAPFVGAVAAAVLGAIAGTCALAPKAFAQNAGASGPSGIAPPARLEAAPESPLKELPYSPSLDVTSMDRTADPCDDLYQFSCGGWIKNNPIPPDQTRWDVYGKVYDNNQRYLWGILDEAG